MRIATDQFVNGVHPTGTVEQHPCVELRAANGQVWAQIAVEEGEDVPTEGVFIASEDADQVTVALTANPSGLWSTVPMSTGAQISSRPGYPRLVL